MTTSRTAKATAAAAVINRRARLERLATELRDAGALVLFPGQETRAPMESASIRNHNNGITVHVRSIEGISHAVSYPRVAWELVNLKGIEA